MKRTSALILSIIILPMLTACGKTAVDNVSLNDPNASNGTYQTETMPSLETNPENDFSEGIGQNEDIVTAASSKPPAPETAPPPTPTLDPAPTAAPQPTQTTTVETMPTLTSTPTPEPTTTPTPQPTPTSVPEPSPSPEPESNSLNISVTVGSSAFSVKLYDSDTARAFVALLPMTLNMSELNGNEKYYYLPKKLLTDSQQIGSINAGDLMLYGSDCLVLFYESFSTSYSYTKIGYFEDVSGLVDALGHGSVEIMFVTSD